MDSGRSCSPINPRHHKDSSQILVLRSEILQLQASFVPPDLTPDRAHQDMRGLG